MDTGGSFAGTFGIMNEDNAMLAGAMGMLPDDPRLFDAARLARSGGIEYAFQFAEMKESTHVNAMKFVLTGESGRGVTLVGDSTGGGMIETKVVNGYPLRVKGDTFVVLVFDPQQVVIPAHVNHVRANLSACLEDGVSQADGKGALYFFKTAEPPDFRAVRSLLPKLQVSLLKPVLPVITRPNRKPQLFDTMTRWREMARERGLPLWQVAVQYEMASIFADLALAGRDAVLPLHEAIDVADAVGRQLSPNLLCTSRGGACNTLTARRQAAAFKAWYEKTRNENTPRPPGNLI